MIARRWRVPFIFEVRDPWPSALVDLGALRQGSMTHRMLETVERLLYQHAARIITVMEHADRRVSEVGVDARKCVYIPNAAPLSEVGGDVPADLARHLERQTANGRLNLVYAGAHGVSNGLHEVLEALTVLRTRDRTTYDRISVTFVGNGSEKASLQAHAESNGHDDNVFFHDALRKPEMLRVLQRADFVLVHFADAAFKHYGMSANKLFDAMAAGTPVLLASPLADTPVDEVRCGIRYEPGSRDSLAETLVAAVRTSVHDRDAMGMRGRAEAESRYDVKVTAQQLERLLREVVTKR
jgi:glycosyltransferase involved in cell wall biosynthesis